MIYHDNFTLSAALLKQLSTQGLDALPALFQVLVNDAMQTERQKHPGAAPHEKYLGAHGPRQRLLRQGSHYPLR